MEYKNHKFNSTLEGNASTFHHFKGHDYQIICIGKSTENEEDMIVYKDNDNHIWIRPAEMFFSPVDKEKYPDVMQEERFELR